MAPRGRPNSQLYKSKTDSIDVSDADWYRAGITCLGSASLSPRVCSMAVHVQSLFVT